MPEGQNYDFINKSETANKISLMSDDSIVGRYLIMAPEVRKQTKYDVVETWRKEFFDQAYLPDEKNNDIYAHPFTASLSGAPLSHIPTEIKDLVIVPFTISEGVKVNAKNLVKDLEQILKDNYTETMKSVGKKQVSQFINDVSQFFVETLLRGIISISIYANDDSVPLTPEDCKEFGDAEVTD